MFKIQHYLIYNHKQIIEYHFSNTHIASDHESVKSTTQYLKMRVLEWLQKLTCMKNLTSRWTG